MILLGEIGWGKENDIPLQQMSIEKILEEQRVEKQTKLEANKLKVQALTDRALSLPGAGIRWLTGCCSLEQGLSLMNVVPGHLTFD